MLLAFGKGSIKNQASHASSTIARKAIPIEPMALRALEARTADRRLADRFDRLHRVGPMVQGANSSSPTPCCSLLVGRTAGHVEDHVEEPAADVLDRLAFQDRTGVHVHVGDHPLVHRRVGRELDARRRLQPQHAAAARREDQHIGPAGDRARSCTVGRSRACP